MADLLPYKNKLMELSYEDKIQMSEWLHTQIDLERGQAVKEKLKETAQKTESFLNKAAEITSSGSKGLASSFRKAFGMQSNQNSEESSSGPEKR